MTTRQFQTIAYIDCVNLKKNSGEVNYRVLWNYLRDRFETRNNGLSVKIFIPLAVNEKREDVNFITYLERIGYEVITSTSTMTLDGRTYKDDTDFVMTITAMDDLQNKNVTNFVILSGDKDFLPLMERIIHNGRDVDVIGPQKNTCYEYKKMRGFVSIEMINGSLAVQRLLDKQSFVGVR
jgi:uncharacterized LabA/DUF88 family protein